MLNEITIGNIKIGGNNPCFLIAEAGVNHNGDISLAYKMIDIAKKAEVDAIKFQTYKTEELVIKSDKQYSMLKKYELTIDNFFALKKYCDKKEIIFLSTPFDIKSLYNLFLLNIPAYKISSGDLNNFQLIKKICALNKPIIMSTGMSTLEEVHFSWSFMKENKAKDIIIMQCTTSYPTKNRDVHLNVIDLYKKVFPNDIIGFSDHTLGISASLGAIAKRIKVIEKHFTLDNTMKGPDHLSSLNPQELFEWQENIRNLEAQLGDSNKYPSLDELKIRSHARKSIVSIADIENGEEITSRNISVKRPVIGISAVHFYNILGKRANRNIKSNSAIFWNDIEYV